MFFMCFCWDLQGCYSSVVDYFEMYIYVAGALAIVVLTIEVRYYIMPILFINISENWFKTAEDKMPDLDR